MRTVRRALITGSFDPITRGHEALLAEASRLFDEVVLGLFINPDKTYLFTKEERLAMLSAVAEGYPCASVVFSDGMVADFARENGICCIFKGIRNEKDLAYEKEMADYNLAHSGVPTVFLPAKEENIGISSSLVRESLTKGILPKEMLPEAILPLVAKKMSSFAK